MEEPERSPLVVIREKEIELAERLAAAKRAADDAILAARQWAATYRDQAEREGQQAALDWYHAQLEQADLEAQRIIGEGEREAAQITERGRRVLPQAVERILEIVLPHSASE